MIVHIISSLKVGGTEMMLKKLVLARREVDLKDIVICLGSEGTIGRQLECNGVQVYYLEIKSTCCFFKGIKKLYRLLKIYKPKVVQTWLYHSDFIGGIIAKITGAKVVWNIRQTRFTSYQSFPTIVIMRICTLLSYFLPDVIVCAANASKVSHLKYGYSRKKIIVIPNGFESAKTLAYADINILRHKFSVNENEVIVGTVGRFHPDKDYLTFIKACKIVSLEFPFVKFMMVGRNLDQNNPILLDWIKSFHLEKRFILVGESNEVNSFLSIFDVFCLSSISEGFPNVVGEAMLKGIACVVTNSGDSALIVGNTGCVAKISDPDSLASSIIKLLSLSIEERGGLGEAAKQRVKQNFMLENSVAKYSELYFNLSKS